ncbi:hypothetical protein DU505_20665 [Billgrantia montanilacus]|uniref:HEPN AbiU2-like domain-containing protein n=1 Tax=Billgrantia montanilacus TaxID=2282305 RepID=A0A368TTK6_9GAMM|nr:hypothetical protein DU505_20665 [Halomonas montanilacus]
MKITEQQLIRAIYSIWDFQQALSALTFLLEDCDFDRNYDKVSLRRFRCYESTLIVSMARPFETTRRGTTIGLRALGITLSQEEKRLVARILELRRKIVAHSDEEEMHFRSTSFPVLDGKGNFPHFQFNEGLHLEEHELHRLETLLRSLKAKLAEFFFRVAQEQPELLEKCREPDSIAKSE